MPEQPSSPAVQDDKIRKLKYWGLGLVLLGLVFELLIFPILRSAWFLVVGMVLCGIGLVWYGWASGSESVKRKWGWVDALGLVAIVVIPLAVAIPNFMTYGAKARQSEAKVGLGGIYTTATYFFAENKTFVVSDIKQLGYAPSGTPRYTFWYSVKGVPTRINVVSSDRAYGCDGPPTIAKVAASATGFTAAARGNMDGDETCDEWSINDARVLTNTINDVNN